MNETEETSWQRKVRNALEDLPEPWPSSRELPPRSRIARYLDALRARLNWLVQQEDRLGNDQRNVNRVRQERNALIWALRQFEPEKGDLIGPLVPKTQSLKADPAYVRRMLSECADLEREGFTRVEMSKPSLLFHEKRQDAAAAAVSLSVWFFFAGKAAIGKD